MSSPTVFERRDGVVHVMTSAPCPDCDDDFPAQKPAVIGGSLAYTQCDAHPTSVRAVSPDGVVFVVHVGHRPGLLDAWEEVRVDPPVLLRALDQIVTAPGSWLVDVNAGVEEQRAQVLRAVSWAAYGFKRASAREWFLAGLDDPWQAGPWKQEGIWPEECGAWRDAGFTDAKEAAMWRTGQARPDQAKAFGDIRAWVFAKHASLLPAGPAWGALWDAVNPDFAAEGFELDQTPEGVRRLGRALSRDLPEEQVQERALYAAGALLRAPWSRQRSSALIKMLRHLRRLDWADVAACMETGMSLGDAREHVASGKDMGPIRLVAALAG